MLAEGIEVQGASLDNGLLAVDLVRPRPVARVRNIEIASSKSKRAKATLVAVDAGASDAPDSRAEGGEA